MSMSSPPANFCAFSMTDFVFSNSVCRSVAISPVIPLLNRSAIDTVALRCPLRSFPLRLSKPFCSGSGSSVSISALPAPPDLASNSGFDNHIAIWVTAYTKTVSNVCFVAETASRTSKGFSYPVVAFAAAGVIV